METSVRHTIHQQQRSGNDVWTCHMTRFNASAFSSDLRETHQRRLLHRGPPLRSLSSVLGTRFGACTVGGWDGVPGPAACACAPCFRFVLVSGHLAVCFYIFVGVSFWCCTYIGASCFLFPHCLLSISLSVSSEAPNSEQCEGNPHSQTLNYMQ